LENHENRPENHLWSRKIQYLRGLATTRQQEKRRKSSTQKRKIQEKAWKRVYIMCDYLHISRQFKETASTRKSRKQRTSKKDSEP
jgi:hypothetical protein